MSPTPGRKKATHTPVSEETLDRLKVFFRRAVATQNGEKNVHVTVGEIKEATKLSEMTIYRGLRHLAREGLLTVVDQVAPNRPKTYIWIDDAEDLETIAVSRTVMFRLDQELKRLSQQVERLQEENRLLQEQLEAVTSRRA